MNEWIILDTLARPDVPMVMLNGNLDKVCTSRGSDLQQWCQSTALCPKPVLLEVTPTPPSLSPADPAHVRLPTTPPLPSGALFFRPCFVFFPLVASLSRDAVLYVAARGILPAHFFPGAVQRQGTVPQELRDGVLPQGAAGGVDFQSLCDRGLAGDGEKTQQQHLG